MSHQLKLIIFDCDGVMFDSREANRCYYNSLLHQFGRPEMDEDELSYVHMHNVVDSTNHIFRNYPDQDMVQVDLHRQQLDYTPFLKYMTMEGDLIEFLETNRLKYHLAISTNRTNTMEPLLKTFKLEHYFEKVMTASNATRPKPAPDALYEILDHYQCAVEEAIYIGDSAVDYEHTAACGMRLIAFKNDALPADYHVHSFREILTLPPFQQA